MYYGMAMSVRLSVHPSVCHTLDNDPIIIEGVIALGLRKLLENEFLFIFSLIV
jgi:hypothetical protein